MIQNFFALLVFLWCACAFAQAGEVVLLIKPRNEAGALQEAFNRLKGELSLHGFSVRVVEVDGPVDPGVLEVRADHESAVASVSFVPATGSAATELSRVDVWIGDRVSGTTSKRTIVPGKGDQGPEVLALRALELLRSSLRAAAEDEPDETVEGAHPERAKKAVEKLRTADGSALGFFVSVGFVVARSFPHVSTSVGPELGAGFADRYWGVRAVAQGPLLGGTSSASTASSASFDALTVLLVVEPLFIPLTTRHVRLLVFPSVGASYVTVNGQAEEPFSGRTDATWVAALGAGAEAALRLNRALEVLLSGRAHVLAPGPVVNLADETKTMGRPVLAGALGARLSF